MKLDDLSTMETRIGWIEYRLDNDEDELGVLRDEFLIIDYCGFEIVIDMKAVDIVGTGYGIVFNGDWYSYVHQFIEDGNDGHGDTWTVLDCGIYD